MSARVVSGVIPNLINGVSQQAPALRLPTQGDAVENFYSTVVEGLKDRPPSEFVARLLDGVPSSVFTHIINRDKQERYVLVSDGSSIRVWDFDGNEKTVNAPDGWGYLGGLSAPTTDLKAVTVADYTFVCNKTKVAKMAASPLAPSRGKEALVNVMAGNYGKTYAIEINGGTAAYYATPNGDAADQAPRVDTVYIAQQLAHGLINAGYSAGAWRIGQYQNAIHIMRVDGGDFTINSRDGYNGNAMKAIKDRVQKFSDLPVFGPHGFIAKVEGDPSNKFDYYWVALDTSASGPGVWHECVAPGLPLQLDGSTMPHVLVREADGSFTFHQQEWDPRKCGDEELSPDPSFAGRKINDVLFHRNRLGFLSGENVIMSRNGSFFDFFRTTALAVLDDDPIDVGATHDKVSILNHAVPFNDDLLVFSECTQFKLAGNDMLTPKTVSLKPLTEFINDPTAKPLTLGTSVFFSARRGEWEGMWEYLIDRVTATPVADEITAHVPAYIPAGIFRIVGTSNESVVLALTTGDPSAVYLYRYYWSSNQKLQAAWQRWRLAGNPRIHNAAFVESDLCVVVGRDDGVYLEKLRVRPNAFDAGLGFLVHLDQRVHSDALPAPVYDADSKTTAYKVPYVPPPDLIAVTAPGGPTLPAVDLDVTEVDAASRMVRLRGDTRDYKLWFGRNYGRRYRFSQFFHRQQSQNGGSTAVQVGRLQLAYLILSYNKSAYFRVEVTPLGRRTFTHVVTGRNLGDANNLPGKVPLISGKKSVPLLSRSDRIMVEIVNDSWMPSSFISATWAGKLNERVKEL